MKTVLTSVLSTAASLLMASSALAATEISWWHAMTGANNEVVDQLAKEFNESQSDYKVVPVFKGTYPETLNAGIAAFRAKQPPAIMQVFDAGSGVMMGAQGAIVPVAECRIPTVTSVSVTAKPVVLTAAVAGVCALAVWVRPMPISGTAAAPRNHRRR